MTAAAVVATTLALTTPPLFLLILLFEGRHAARGDGCGGERAEVEARETADG